MAAVIKLRFFSMKNLANCSVIFNDKIDWTWSRVHCSQAIQFASPLSLCPERARYRLMYVKSSQRLLYDIPYEVRSRVAGWLVLDVSWSYLQGSTLKDEITKLAGCRTPITQWRCAIFQKKGDPNYSSEKSWQLAFALRSIVVLLRCICLWRICDRKASMVTAYNELAIPHCDSLPYHQNYVRRVTTSQGL